MTERISIAALRDKIARASDPGYDYPAFRPEAVLALVEAAEAAHALIDHTITDLYEVGRREVELSRKLRHFDFGRES